MHRFVCSLCLLVGLSGCVRVFQDEVAVKRRFGKVDDDVLYPGANRYNRDAVRNWRDDILATHGQSRDMPDEHLFRRQQNAKPGTLVRFGGRF